MVRWLLAWILIMSLAGGARLASASDDSLAQVDLAHSPQLDASDNPEEAEDDEAEEGGDGEDDEDADEEDEDSDEESAENATEEEKRGDEKDKEPAGETKSAEAKDKKSASENESTDAGKENAESKSAQSKSKASDKDQTSSKESNSDDKKAADKKASEAKAAEKKPETHKVAKKKLKIEVEADAVFVAEEAEEVALRPEAWSNFKVLEAVPHGARVRKGDVLVKFDPKEIDKQLAEKSLALRLGEIALLQAEEEFPRLEKSIELTYEEAERTYKEAQDEQDRFNKTMRGLSEKMAEYMLKSAEQDYENATEELEQLEKMYEADELTEETEEIVLKRQKFQVDAAKFFLEYSKINHEYTTTVSIPRRAESLQTAVDAAKIEFERAKMAKSLGMNEQRYQLQQLREARAKSLEDYAKLEADRQLMTLKAPADGIAYYGRCVNGRWMEVSSLEGKLIPFGNVTPNSVVMTVVKDRPMYVETSIGEKELPTVDENQPVKVSLAADGDVELPGKVKKVGDVPGAGNKFVVRVDVDSNEAPEWLMPGMTAKAKITTYDVEDAIVISADLLQSDEEEPKKKYVMVQVDGEDKPVRRDVKVGRTKDKEVEILKGLKAGDEIVKGAKDDGDEQDADEKKADEKANEAEQDAEKKSDAPKEREADKDAKSEKDAKPADKEADEDKADESDQEDEEKEKQDEEEEEEEEKEDGE